MGVGNFPDWGALNPGAGWENLFPEAPQGGFLGGIQGLLGLLGQGVPGGAPSSQDDIIVRWNEELGRNVIGIPQYERDVATGELSISGYTWQLAPQEGAGGGGGGAVQFPSQANLQNAQADQIRAMMELLMPQFELEQQQFGLQEQQFAHQQAEDAAQREIQEALLALQEGRLSLDQFRLQVESVLQQRGMDIEEMLGMRGLDIQETLGMGGLASEEANRALTRELGFASLEEQRKDRALDSAMGAISSYLQGMSLADSRRIASFQETRALIPFMVDPERETWFDPQGSLAQAVGPGFDPGQIHHIDVPDPSQLAAPPTQEQVGGGLMDLLGGLPQ